MRAQAHHKQRLSAFTQQGACGFNGLTTGLAALDSGHNRRGLHANLSRIFDQPELNVHGKQQCHATPKPGGANGVRQGSPGALGIAGHIGFHAASCQHARHIELFDVGLSSARSMVGNRTGAKDDKHTRPGSLRIRSTVHGVGGCRAPANDGHTQLAGGGGITFGHRDRIVLVPGRVEANANGIKRGHEECCVVAHESEHCFDPSVLDVMGQRFVGGYLAGAGGRTVNTRVG